MDGGAFTCVRDREFDVPRDDVWTLNQEALALRIDWVDKKSGEGKTPIYHLRIRDCFEAVHSFDSSAVSATILQCTEKSRLVASAIACNLNRVIQFFISGQG